MRTFHHGGRIGDCVYSLYTVKMMGGGEIYLTSFHTPGWNKSMAESMLSFLDYQEYVIKSYFVDIDDLDLASWRQTQVVPKEISWIDYDLHLAENDRNPEKFPEWHGRVWPGNCHIAKRYAVHFDIEWDPESVWLTAPKTKSVDVVFHMPMRRMVRHQEEWASILRRIKDAGRTVVIIGAADADEWIPYCPDIDIQKPRDILEAADYINSCSVFIGGASSGNTIAEGLKKNRIVELADDCDDTYPHGLTGHFANILGSDQIVSTALDLSI